MDAIEPPRVAVLKRSARHIARRWVTRHPALYMPLTRARHEDPIVDESTDIVIDGFMRSAGTFAVVALQLAQNDHVRVAHHVHAAAHFIAAAELHTPTLITVRPPEPAIVSAMLWDPLVTPGQWLKFYAQFYERILPLRDQFVVATFEEVTNDFGAVTRRVNERFGTDFREFQHTEKNVATCFAVIEERSQGPPWAIPVRRFLAGTMTADEYFGLTQPFRQERARHLRRVSEQRVPRPSEERDGLKDYVRSRYLAPGLAGLRRRAERAYRRFVQQPPGSVSVEPVD